MALTQKDQEWIASAIVAGIATALNEVARPAEAAPEAKAKAESPFVDAPKGERMHATRAANLANKVAGKHCPACEVGFAFKKATCPRCGKSL